MREHRPFAASDLVSDHEPESPPLVRPRVARQIQRHAEESGASTSPRADAGEAPQAKRDRWLGVVDRIERGDVPNEEELPPGNEVARARLGQLRDDPQVAELRGQFLQLLSQRLRKLPEAPANLFREMQAVFAANTATFARKGKGSPDAKEMSERLGTIVRAESYQAIIVNQKVRPEYFRKGGDWYDRFRADHPGAPAEPWKTAPDWAIFNEIYKYAPKIEPGDFKDDALLGKAGKSVWITGDKQLAGGSNIAEKLALEDDLAQRAVIFYTDSSRVASAPDPENPEHAQNGHSARRPTALDFMASPVGGAFNDDEETKNFGVTSGGKLEVVVPPIPIAGCRLDYWGESA